MTQAFAKWLVPHLALRTPYEVELRDRKLCLLLSLSRGIVIAYIIVRVLLFWTIIDYEPVLGSYNAWTALSWNTGKPNRDEELCNGDPKYNFWPINPGLQGGNMATNFSCPVFRGSEIARQVGDEMRVTTSIWRQAKKNPPDCRIAPAWPTASNDEYVKFTQVCTNNHFVRRVEKLPIWIIHSVSGVGLQREDMECEIVPPEGSTTLPKYEWTNSTVSQGVGWQTNLDELLHFAGGYTLDSHNSGNDFEMVEGFPRLRLTGFILTLRFQYFNYASISGRHSEWWSITSPAQPHCKLTVELHRMAWGFTGGTESGDDIAVEMVARIKMVSEGAFGELDWILVVSSLVEGFVLLGFASVLTREIAKLLYKESFREKTEIVYDGICPLTTKTHVNDLNGRLETSNAVAAICDACTQTVPSRFCSDAKKVDMHQAMDDDQREVMNKLCCDVLSERAKPVLAL